jgi:hypothetical protein
MPAPTFAPSAPALPALGHPPPPDPWHIACEWSGTMNSIFYIIGVVVVIVVILKLLGLF